MRRKTASLATCLLFALFSDGNNHLIQFSNFELCLTKDHIVLLKHITVIITITTVCFEPKLVPCQVQKYNFKSILMGADDSISSECSLISPQNQLF